MIIKKRLFSVLMAIVMVFSILPTFVFAETGDTFTINTDAGIPVSYKVLTEDASGGTVAVAGQGSNPAIPTDTTGLVLPNKVESNGKTYTVTEIGESAFEGCTSLGWIELPNSLTKIGASAFKGCTSLLEIDIPNSVTSIGDNAFKDCSYLHTFISGSKTPAKLGKDVFVNCDSNFGIAILNGTKQTYINAGWPKDYLHEVSIFEGRIIDTYFIPYQSAAIDVNSNPIDKDSGVISGATVSIYDKEGNFKGSVKTDEYGYFEATAYVEYGVEQTAKIEKDGYMTMSMNFIPIYSERGAVYYIPLAKADIGFNANTVEKVPITYQILTKDETRKTGTVRIVCGQGFLYSESITLPNTVMHDGITYTVTEIGNYAFSSNYGINTVVLPSSLENIGEYAFSKSELDIISNYQVPVQTAHTMLARSNDSVIYIPMGTKQAYIDAGWVDTYGEPLNLIEVEFSSLSGKVVDENGNGIANAKVTIYNDSGYQESVYSDSEGRYWFNNYFLNGEFVNSYIENGCNKIKVEKAGYQEFVVNIDLDESDVTDFDIVMTLAPNVPGDDPGDVPGDVPGDDPGDVPGDVPGDDPGDDPGDVPGDVPGDGNLPDFPTPTPSLPTPTPTPNKPSAPTNNPVTPTNNAQTTINNTPQTGDNSGTIIYVAFGCMLIAILAAGCIVVAKRRNNGI